MNSRIKEPRKPKRGVIGERRWKQLSLSGRRIERNEGGAPSEAIKAEIIESRGVGGCRRRGVLVMGGGCDGDGCCLLAAQMAGDREEAREEK